MMVVVILIGIALMIISELVLRVLKRKDARADKCDETVRYIINGVPTAYMNRCIEDDIFAFKLKPNFKEHHCDNRYGFDFNFETNSDGFRQSGEINLSVEKSKNKPKIMMLGDSVAFCWGVQQKHTFSGIMNSLFDSSCHVYNFGVTGWSFAEYYLTHKQYKHVIKPELVIIATSPGDFNELEHTHWQGKSKRALPERISRTDYHIDPEGYFRYTKSADGSLFLCRSYLWKYIFERIYKKIKSYKANSFKIAADIIKEISNEVPVFIAFLPAQYSYSNGTYDKTATDRFKKALRHVDNIHILDLYPMFLKEDRYKKFYLDGIHFTVEGNRFAAGKLVDFIKKCNLLAI